MRKQYLMNAVSCTAAYRFRIERNSYGEQCCRCSSQPMCVRHLLDFENEIFTTTNNNNNNKIWTANEGEIEHSRKKEKKKQQRLIIASIIRSQLYNFMKRNSLIIFEIISNARFRIGCAHIVCRDIVRNGADRRRLESRAIAKRGWIISNVWHGRVEFVVPVRYEERALGDARRRSITHFLKTPDRKCAEHWGFYFHRSTIALSNPLELLPDSQ